MLPRAYRGSLLTSEPNAGPWLLSRGQAGENGEDTWDHVAQMEEEEEEEEERSRSLNFSISFLHFIRVVMPIC